MSRNPQDGWRPPEPPGRPPRPSMPPRSPMGGGGNPRSRWMPWVVVGVITLAFIIIFSNGLPGSSTTRTKLSFNQLQTQVTSDNVKSITYNRDSGDITGVFKAPVQNNLEFSTTGPPVNFDDATLALLRKHNVTLDYTKSGSNLWGQLLPFALPLAADRRLARLDEPAGAGRHGRGDEHRAQPGEGVQRPRSRRRPSPTSPATGR